MELTWINKLRIAAVAGLGILAIGILAWPLAAPADPLIPVRAANIGLLGTAALLLLSFGLGFAGYFVAWPHGREIGILSVPFGLTVWAGRSGPMRVLTQALPQPAERAALAFSLWLEPLYWLLLVAAGFAGVLVAQRLRTPADKGATDQPAHNYANVNTYLTIGLALLATVLISHFFVGVFVEDVAASRGVTPTQPPVGQILFGVTAAFTVAAFILKKFANLSYLCPATASAFVIAFAEMVYGQAETIRQFAETRPATFFPHSTLTVLPVQFVALGTLGSIIGYWLAVRYEWWRKHESVG